MKKILVLAPHDLVLDPRIKWMIDSILSFGEVTAHGIKQIPRDPIFDDQIKIRQSSFSMLTLLNLTKIFTLNWKTSLYLSTLTLLSVICYMPLVALKKMFGNRLPGYLKDLALLFYTHRQMLKVFCVLVAPESEGPKNEFDYILANDLDSLTAAVYLKRHNKKCILIYDAHEFYPFQYPGSGACFSMPLSALEKMLLKDVEHFISVTPGLAEAIKAEYGYEKVIHSIPNAAPLLNILSNKSSENEKMIFLFQGQFMKGRGLERLIDFWSRMNLSDKAVLVMRGPDNNVKNDCIELAKKFGSFQKSIHFAEPVPEEELIANAALADVGIIPYEATSINNLNCCPNKLSQYMQAGIAILANDLPFIRKVVTEGSCGFLFRSDDFESFSLAVNVFINDRIALKKMKENSLHYSATNFNWEKLSHPVLLKIFS